MYKPIIDRFRDKHILVVGDVILDKYIDGPVNRVSPEAPTVRKNGGEVQTINLINGKSTTSIISKILESYGKK